MTSLGFSIFSRYDGSGIRRARQDLQRLDKNQELLTASAMRMTRAVALFGPVAVPVFAGAAVAATKASVAFAAAGMGLGIWGLAMKNLTKTNQKAAGQIARLKQAFSEFGTGTATPIMLKTLTNGVTAAIRAMKALEPVVAAVAPVMHKISVELKNFAGGPQMKAFSSWLQVQAPAAIGALWQALKNLGSGFIILGKRLGLFETSGFNIWLVRVTESFKKWASGPEIPKLKAFLGQAGPLTYKFVVALLQLTKALMVALAPLTIFALKILVAVVKWLTAVAREHPRVIQAMWLFLVVVKLVNLVLLIYKSAVVQALIHILRFAAGVLMTTGRLLAHAAATLWASRATLILSLRLRLAALWLRLTMIAQLMLTAAFWRGIAAMVAHGIATAAASAKMIVIRALTLAWAAAQWLLNAALLANPFVLVAIAIIALGVALFIAYKKSETFRNIVNAVFRAVGTVVLWLWNNVLKPFFTFYMAYLSIWWNIVKFVFGAFVMVLRTVGVIAMWLGKNVLIPVFKAIALAAQFLWNTAIKFIFALIVVAFRTAGAAAMWLWRVAIGPAFRAIGAAAVWLWNVALKPVLTPIWNLMKVVGNAAMWLWRVAIGPAFRAIGAAAMWLWNNIIRPVFTAIRNFFNALGRAGDDMRNKNVTAFTIIGNAASRLWNGIIRPVFTAMFNFFRTVGNGIVSTWRTVSNFLVNVWNGAWNRIRAILNGAWGRIRGTFNTIRGFIGGVFRAIASISSNIWNGMWNRIRSIFNGAWSRIRTTFNAIRGGIGSAFRAIYRTAADVWNRMWNRIRSIFSGAWSAIRTTFNTIRSWIGSAFRAIYRTAADVWKRMWDRVRSIFSGAWGHLRTTFDAMKKYIPKIFRGIVSAVKGIWEGIKSVIAKPINFVIGFVADKLIPFANKAMSLVLGKKAPKINGGALKGFQIKGYAGGGILPGYTPGRDVHIAQSPAGPIGLSGGEGILRPEVMRAPGMADFLHTMNAAARLGGISGVKSKMAPPGLAKGGEFKQAYFEKHNLFYGSGASVIKAAGNMPGFSKGGVVGGVKTARNFDIGGIFNGIKRAAKILIPQVGFFDMSKKMIEEKGFSMLAEKALGKLYNGALNYLAGNMGPMGVLIGGTMAKVVKAIMGFVGEKLGGGGSSSVVAAAIKYIGKGDRGGVDNDQNQFNDQWGTPGVPWCANFVSTCIKDANAGKFYPGYPTAAVQGFYQKMQKAPWGSAQPGDLRATVRKGSHINIVEKKVGNAVHTIGGNQGPLVNRRVDHSGVILRPKPGAGGGGGSGGGGEKKGKTPGGFFGGTLGSMGGGGGGGGACYITHFWDPPPLAGGGAMTKNTLASSYIPLGSVLNVSKAGKSMTGTIDDLGPAKYVYNRHPGMAVIDVATGTLPGDGMGNFRIVSVGKGRTLYGKNLRGYANGGVMSPGELAVVGERGPELFKAGSGGGEIFSNGSKVGGGDIHVHLHDPIIAGSQRAVQDMVVTAVAEAKRKKKI